MLTSTVAGTCSMGTYGDRKMVNYNTESRNSYTSKLTQTARQSAPAVHLATPHLAKQRSLSLLLLLSGRCEEDTLASQLCSTKLSLLAVADSRPWSAWTGGPCQLPLMYWGSVWRAQAPVGLDLGAIGVPSGSRLLCDRR